MAPKKTQFKQRLQDLGGEDYSLSENFFQVQPMQAETTTTTTTLVTNAQPVAEHTSADEYDGQLAIDVYQDDKNVYVRAIVGGIKSEDIEVHLNNDMVTIKGKRLVPGPTNPEQYFIQECYWGGFSRSIILPIDIKNDAVEANLEHGVLLLTLPKSHRPKNTRIPVKAT
ncbi:MAG: Hsp20/alpha crystallin family protein [Patescibacteria group bacterium]|jgi:HSP20 family protein